MMGQKILVVGATSCIAEHAARVWAERGAELHLVGRNESKLAAIAADLRIRGAVSVSTQVADLLDLQGHETLLNVALAQLGGRIDVALIAHGVLKPDGGDPGELVRKIIDTNATSAISVLEILASMFEVQRSGVVAVIGSVAGDRGRATNGLYGAAKAALATHASAMRQRLARSGAWVVTVKPGFVDTPMTAGFQKGPLWASPSAVGRGIVRAVDRRQAVVYLPFFWGWIMWLIRLLPEKIFLRTRF